MPYRFHFLVVDNHRDNRYLLTKTLLRRFPAATVEECDDSAGAVRIAKEHDLTAIVAHRADDMDGISLIRELREVNPDLPILAVSGHDRRASALAAGANAFLHYDAWLSLGRVVEDLLRTGVTPSPFEIEPAIGDAPERNGDALRDPKPPTSSIR